MVLKALVSGQQHGAQSPGQWGFLAWQVMLHLQHDLPGNEKPLTTDQTFWYLNDRYFYEVFNMDTSSYFKLVPVDY